MTTAFAVIIAAIEFVIGSAIGLAVAALVYRSRLSRRLGVRTAFFGGVACVIAAGIAGWAGAHTAFQNGQRVDIAPWGEDLWLRNRIVENERLLCVASSVVAALLTGVRSGKS